MSEKVPRDVLRMDVKGNKPKWYSEGPHSIPRNRRRGTQTSRKVPRKRM
jgi:hypothetical protein